MRWLLPICVGLWAGGCVLETEACGPDFVEAEGRCVPVEAPPAYYAAAEDGSAADAGPGRDLGAAQDGDDGVPRDAAPDPVDGGAPRPDPERPRSVVVIADTTPRDVVAQAPFAPGVDLDAVIVAGPDGEFGFGVGVAVDAIADPFGTSESTDPRGALGEPDAIGLRDPARFTSIGGEGAALGLVLPFPLSVDTEITVFEVAGDGDDSYVLFLCPDVADLQVSDCVAVGPGGSGASSFVVGP